MEDHKIKYGCIQNMKITINFLTSVGFEYNTFYYTKCVEMKLLT